MKRLIIRSLCIYMAIIGLVGVCSPASASSFNQTFVPNTHLHHGVCQVICSDTATGRSLTYRTICDCGVDMGSFNMCEAICNHNFERTYKGNKFESDECSICGFLRIHSAPEAMLFLVRKASVNIRSKPYESADAVRVANEGERINVIGRVRNKYNNLWLMLDDGTYVWAENVAFDLDSTLVYACGTVGILGDWNNGDPSASWLSNYFTSFMTGGRFDFKHINMLGVNSFDYFVYANGKVQEERMTGEMIGNFVYGFTSAFSGMSTDITIQLGGLGGMLTSKGILSNLSAIAQCATGNLATCDAPNDINEVLRGWDYFQSGKWD